MNRIIVFVKTILTYIVDMFAELHGKEFEDNEVIEDMGLTNQIEFKD
jgi:hypothetical protein